MDLIRQNKFLSWAIALLVVLNLLTLAMIWIQAERSPRPPDRPGEMPKAAPVALMQQTLGLDARQAELYQQLRGVQQDKMRAINDELDALKLDLADEIFKTDLNETHVDSMVANIGRLQSELEHLRFNHFRALAQICNDGQKKKLLPILKEVIGRKGQSEKRKVRAERERPSPPGGVQALQEEPPPQRPDANRRPPSKDERLNRLVQRVPLNEAQRKQVAAILDSTREKEENFKADYRPTEEEFEREKERFRREEDDSILRLLQPDQKAEFMKMKKNRDRK